MIDKTVYWNMLYDYYGCLLTDKQRDLFEDYYFDNLTLQEIADNNAISRNAVHKTLNIITLKLEKYEDLLGYNKRINKIKEIIKDEKILNEILEIL
jgi:predicted DNA-binding protein YlxM (UPF0122 family)